MIVLDTSIVNVALPSIECDLKFSDASLVWVVNSYMLSFGGTILLGGRLGDLYGHRRFFLFGVAIFTFASLACGLSHDQISLIALRTIQGIGGALVLALALSIIVKIFPDPADYSNAMGIYGFVCAIGGGIGTLMGGVLTQLVGWRWIFLINLPIGVVVWGACAMLLPKLVSPVNARTIDLPGAVSMTAALVCADYAIVCANNVGWASPQTLGLFATACCLMFGFLYIESRTAFPLVPLELFRMRNLVAANIINFLRAAALFGWLFVAALYLQDVLNYEPLEVGLAFLPENIAMAVFSICFSTRLVERYGIRLPLTVGLLTFTAGLLLFSRAPLHGHFLEDILPAMLLLGVGSGCAFNPLILVAMHDAAPRNTGFAAGVINTSFITGGSVGLALSASLASARTAHLVVSGDNPLEALIKGYQAAFFFSAVLSGAAFAISVLSLRVEAVLREESGMGDRNQQIPQFERDIS